MNEHDLFIWVIGILASALAGLIVKYRRDTHKLKSDNESLHESLRFVGGLACRWEQRAEALGWGKLEPFREVVEEVVPEDL